VGTVNNWHWTDYNCTPWVHSYIHANVPGVSVQQGAVDVKITKVDDLEGTVTISNRKGKVKFYYELTFSVLWEGIASRSPSTQLSPTHRLIQATPTRPTARAASRSSSSRRTTSWTTTTMRSPSARAATSARPSPTSSRSSSCQSCATR